MNHGSPGGRNLIKNRTQSAMNYLSKNKGSSARARAKFNLCGKKDERASAEPSGGAMLGRTRNQW